MRRIAIGLCFAAACGHPRDVWERSGYHVSLGTMTYEPTHAADTVVEDRLASFDHYRRAVELAANGDADDALAALESAIEAWPANRAARVAYLKIHPHLDPTRPHRPFEPIDSVGDIEVRLRLIAAHLNFVYGRFEARAYADAAAACEQILWLAPDYTVARMLKLDAGILARDPSRHDAVLAKIAGLRALGTETEFGIPRGDEVGAPEPGVFRRLFEPLLQQAAATPARNDVPGECGMTPADVVAAAYAPPRNDVPGECGMTPQDVEAAAELEPRIWRAGVPSSAASLEIGDALRGGIVALWCADAASALTHLKRAEELMLIHDRHPCAASLPDVRDLVLLAERGITGDVGLSVAACFRPTCHPPVVPKPPIQDDDLPISDEDLAIPKLLAVQPVSLDLVDVPLAEFIRALSEHTGLNFAAVNADIRVTAQLNEVTAETALSVALGAVDLSWTVEDGVVIIAPAAPHELQTRLEVYEIDDLVYSVPEQSFLPPPPNDEALPTSDELLERLEREVTIGDDGRSLQVHQGVLIVRAPIHEHDAIAAWLNLQRADREFRFRLGSQQSFLKAQNLARCGRRHLDAGETADALKRFGDALSLIESRPTCQEEFDLLRAEVEGLIAQAERREILEFVRARLDAAFVLLMKARVKEAAAAVEPILELDPHYVVAVEIKYDARRDYSTPTYFGGIERKVAAWKRLFEASKDSVIPYEKTFSFPSREKWIEASRRALEPEPENQRTKKPENIHVEGSPHAPK